jgi:hypothetical protein
MLAKILKMLLFQKTDNKERSKLLRYFVWKRSGVSQDGEAAVAIP